MHYYLLRVNPEPWAIGPVTPGRRNNKLFATVGQNQQLAAYQAAILDEISLQNPVKLTGNLDIRFFFWRNRAAYTTANQRQHRKHEADCTNLIKATEDALQGILFDNDRDNTHVEGWLVEQGPETEGMVFVCIDTVQPEKAWAILPMEFWTLLNVPPVKKDDNKWP
jgi:Holliday junction resolvase RusA-like endonuclease